MSLLVEAMRSVRRKCFISYHHADEAAVRQFVDIFDHTHDVLIRRRLGESPDDLIKSTNTDYVMNQVRARFLKDSTVTIVMMGRCTWARRYVDWEIQGSLRRGQTAPNGLLGIKLPSFGGFPPRFNSNLIAAGSGQTDCYARWMNYPQSTADLRKAIEAAYSRRSTHGRWIVNPRDKMAYNRSCQ